jgi:hypothetical protein
MRSYRLAFSCLLTIYFASASCVRTVPDNMLRPAGEAERQRRELEALPRLTAREIRVLDDWLRLSSDRRAVFLNLAYVGDDDGPPDDNACRDHGPIRMKGNFRPTFGTGHVVYCSPANNWALLDIGWLLTEHDVRVVRCVNVQDSVDHWSQHGGTTFAPGLGEVGGPTRDAFNVQFTHLGDGTLEFINDPEASRRGMRKPPC